MEKRKIELGVAALAAGAGVAALAARNHKTAVETEVKKAAGAAKPEQEYRNTERGKYEKKAKAFTIRTATMKPSQDQRNRQAWKKRVHIS